MNELESYCSFESRVLERERERDLCSLYSYTTLFIVYRMVS